MFYIIPILSTLLLFVYSYGFLDFNLTLSNNPIFLSFAAPLQHLVYFERMTSAKYYLIIFFLMFISYLWLVLKQARGSLKVFPWKLFLSIVIILTFAYPMLSYDLYNYMFHGKILWFYHMNPHVHAPLEFQGDLWLRFMRWVHTPSAYGPVFTLIESPAYLLGLGKFTLILILMKITMSSFFVWCIHLIKQIMTHLKFSDSRIVQAQILIAFNPFLLLEVVLNGHNDAVMIALFFLSLLYTLKDKIVSSILSLVASVGTKYVTITTLPIYLMRNNKLKVIYAAFALLAPVLLSPGRFQPWYLVWALLPMALIDHAWSKLYIIFASLAGIIFYVPYISTGFWLNSPSFVYKILYLPVLISGSIWYIHNVWTKPK